jgi:hypothetical protein
MLAALLAKSGKGWSPAVMQSHSFRFISISPSFSVHIVCRACGKSQAYGSFEQHAKTCKTKIWHLTSRLTEQEVAEAAEFNSDDDNNDTKATK